MSIESDISSVKSEVKQFSKANNELKSDIRQIKSDITKLKASDPGPFLQVVKGAALVTAISKIDTLNDKVDKVAKAVDEKVKQAKAAREAEEKRLALAEKEEQRLREEHERRLEAARKEKEQRNRITELWVKYQDADKEPDLIKRFFAIKNNFGKNIELDVSFVKEPEFLSQYTELSISHNSLLEKIRKEIGEKTFDSLEDAYDVGKELESLVSCANHRSSYIAECQSVIERIELLKKTVPELTFDNEAQHIILQRIEDYAHNSSLFASLMNESRQANLITENVDKLFLKAASEYNIESDDLPEIFRNVAPAALGKNEWSLFFDRIKRHAPEDFFDDIQVYFDFVSDKAERKHIDLRRENFCKILKGNLRGIVIADHVPFKMEGVSQNVMGYLPMPDAQFVVFFDKSLLWIDCEGEFLDRSTYVSFSETFPPSVKQLIEPVVAKISKLNFVMSEEVELSEDFSVMENKYHDAVNHQQKEKNIILENCRIYAKINLYPRLSLKEDSSGDVLAETEKKELCITEKGFILKMLKGGNINITWEDFSKMRGELSLSLFWRNVVWGGKTTALYTDWRYYRLLQKIVGELYPTTPTKRNGIVRIPSNETRPRMGCFSTVVCAFAVLWSLLGIGLIGAVGMLNQGEVNIEVVIWPFLLCFLIPSLITWRICRSLSLRNRYM